MEERELSASEALYAFCSWLTTRDELIQLSTKNDASRIAELISLFVKHNKLKEPEKGWEHLYTLPKEQ